MIEKEHFSLEEGPASQNYLREVYSENADDVMEFIESP